MLVFTLSFPLGVYHAQSGASSAEPEWPPSPLRLIGALLAAAHGRHSSDPSLDRAVLQRLCEAPPPQIVAPDSVAVGEEIDGDEVVRLRGATRWAPRNYVGRALSPRNLGRERAEVSKAGVAIGDREIHVVWPELELSASDLDRLSLLAGDVTFVGTSRSPVLLRVATHLPDCVIEGSGWRPLDPERIGPAVGVRVPDEQTIEDFDVREASRRSGRDRLRPTGLIPQLAIGRLARYAMPGISPSVETFDPGWWGDMIVLAVDRARSEVIPKLPAAYLFARAVRVALLGAFGAPGTPDEAPVILTARGEDPHCAFVPLPNVWGTRGDGRILGIAIVLPHHTRVPDVAHQRLRIEQAARRLIDEDDVAGNPQRYVRIPNAGFVRFAGASLADARQMALRETSYRRPSRRWVTVTPVVHSRWRKGGSDGLLRQVTADCAHVGLPAPEQVRILRGAGRRGGADRLVALREVPQGWRGPLQGPADHLEITFAEPVAGPLLLGRARHFGVGLCVPAGLPATEVQAA